MISCIAIQLFLLYHPKLRWWCVSLARPEIIDYISPKDYSELLLIIVLFSLRYSWSYITTTVQSSINSSTYLFPPITTPRGWKIHLRTFLAWVKLVRGVVLSNHSYILYCILYTYLPYVVHPFRGDCILCHPTCAPIKKQLRWWWWWFFYSSCAQGFRDIFTPTCCRRSSVVSHQLSVILALASCASVQTHHAHQVL